MERGDVFRVEIPQLPGRPGHEQHGDRYGIVVQADHLNRNPNHTTVQVVPTTTNPACIRFPGAIGLTPTPENGLPAECVAMVHQTRVSDKIRLVARTGRLTNHEMARIDDSLRMLFAL
jgi:mRNA interferase MazF